MKINNNSILISPSEERIESFEEYCGITLPNDFKWLIKKYNGAVPLSNTFSYDGTEYIIERFLCLLKEPELDAINGWYDIEVVLSQIDTRLTDDEDLVGANIIPFALLFAGDYVCLDLRDPKNPSVLIWFHEKSDELHPVTVKVASNIIRFLDMLV